LGLGVTGESPARFPGELETRPVNLKLSNDSMASRGSAGRCEVNADDVPRMSLNTRVSGDEKLALVYVHV
jgi:hypothetical protein